MNTAIEGINLEQAVQAIIAGGSQRTVIIQGDTGSGKTQGTRVMLMNAFPKHKFIQMDCPALEVRDRMIPRFQDREGNDYVQFGPNERLGLHLKEPVIVNIDEIGKGSRSIQNALRPFILQRELNGIKLHPDSIIYCTTNLGAEGLGDVLLPHQRNSVTFIKLRKSTNLEFIQWGALNNINPLILGWAKEEPALFQSFTDVPNPTDNPYIYHPREEREQFTTNRSLAAASFWVDKRDEFDQETLTSLLVGTIGAPAALNLMTFISLAAEFPSIESIKQDPFSAIVPSKLNGQCYVLFRAMAAMERDWVDQWMDYATRLNAEVMAVFASAILNRANGEVHPKQKLFTTNGKFTDWAVANRFLFSADKV